MKRLRLSSIRIFLIPHPVPLPNGRGDPRLSRQRCATRPGSLDCPEPEGAVPAGRVVLRRAPALGERRTRRLRQAAEPRGVVREAHREVRLARGQRLHQVRPVRQRAHAIAGGGEVRGDGPGAFRRVEADREPGPAAAGGIVGEHQRQTPRGPALAGEADPGGGAVGERRDAGGVGHAPALGEARDLRCLRLEGDREAGEPPVEFGQRHLHGEVGGAEASGGGLPGLPGRAHRIGLQDRAIGRVEDEARILAGGEGGGGHDQVGPARRDRGPHGLHRLRVLQAGDGHHQRADPAGGERRRQRRGRGEVAAERRRAVDQDEGVPLSGGGAGGERLFQRHRPAAGAAREAARQRPGLGIGEVVADLGREPAQHLPQVLTASRAEIGVEDGGELRRRGIGGEPRVRPVVARKDDEAHAVRPRGLGAALDAVAPVIEPAEAADHHQLRPRDHLLDVEIDRERVAQPRQPGEAQSGQGRSLGRRGLGDAGEVGIGEGQDDDVPGLLAQIHRRLAFVEGDRIDADEVHAASLNPGPLCA
ncbi:hypothetical protein IFDJLNFL_0385 [Methylobacterium dankookense]|uniref:Uncharacterized protein n=1 Tax=Methylobacterium dankookense TaxID=560405 RepID=A0ABQ4RA31_9HYPH|nr:hypothetical protein IFDJLNFL_0385 [Methylobacterium dankookense]